MALSELEQIMDLSGEFSHVVEDFLDPEEFEKDPSYFLEIAKAAKSLAPYIYRELDTITNSIDRGSVLDIIQRYGEGSYYLLTKTPDVADFEKRHRDSLIEISCFAGEKYEWSWFLPKELMDGYANELVEIAKNAGLASSDVYRLSRLTKENAAVRIRNIVRLTDFGKEDSWEYIKKCEGFIDSEEDVGEYLDVWIKNREMFNFKNNYKYNIRLFCNNLENLDGIDTSKPIALAVVSEMDHDVFGAFGGSFPYQQRFSDNLLELSENYNLFFYEASNMADLKNSISLVSAYGGVSLLMIAGHGSQSGVRFSKGDSEDNELSVHNISELMPYVGSFSADAQIILNSCLCGKGKEDEENLANAAGTVFLGRTVFAAPFSFRYDEIIYDDDRKVNDVLFVKDEGGSITKDRYITKKS